MLYALRRFFKQDSGAVTVDWVVLSAAVVGLMAGGYTLMRDGAVDLTADTQSYMSSVDVGSF